MKRFTPSITIWHLELFNKDHERVSEFFFLTRKRVERFLKVHEKEIDELGLSCAWGGEPLWLL